MTDTSTTITISGVFISVYNVGVLLTGESGIGKSELALSLVYRNHQLISDDAISITKNHEDHLIGHCPPELQDFIEIRGLGILNIRVLYGEHAICDKQRLELIISLQEMKDIKLTAEQRLCGISENVEILGVNVPQYTLPVAPDRNFDILVEAAVEKYKLQKRGYDALSEYKKQIKKYSNCE